MGLGEKNSGEMVERFGFEPSGYYLKIEFGPSINLSKKMGHVFAQAVSGYVDIEEFKLENKSWTFLQNSSGLGIQLHVEKGGIQLHSQKPENRLEWLENRYGPILEKFHDLFGPRIIFSSSAMVRGIVDSGDDARTFLASRLIKVEPDDFGRPIHGLGVRFFFPPWKPKKSGRAKTKAIDWQVNLKVESLLRDPRKLFLEADAEWHLTKPWSRQTTMDAIRHVQYVIDFLNNTVIPYLLKTNPNPPNITQEGEN